MARRKPISLEVIRATWPNLVFPNQELTKARSVVHFICPKHGKGTLLSTSIKPGGRNNEFKFRSGCNKCKHEYNSVNPRDRDYTPSKIRWGEWLVRFRKVHGNKYQYTKPQNLTSYSQILIKCPVHGLFKQNVSSHASGRECRECGRDRHAAKMFLHSRGIPLTILGKDKQWLQELGRKVRTAVLAKSLRTMVENLCYKDSKRTLNRLKRMTRY